MQLRYFDARPHFDTEPVRGLMWLALPFPNDEMLDRILKRYHDDDELRLYGAVDEDDTLQGLIGLRMGDEGEAMLLHLSVNQDAQRQGVGSALVRKAIGVLKLGQLDGRAGEPILPFFTSLGFENRVMGEKPPGTKWYAVTWKKR